MSRRQCYPVKLKPKEKQILIEKTKKGKISINELKRALVLLKSSEGEQDWEIAEELEMSIAGVKNIRKKFQERGIKVVEHAPMSGRPKIIDGDVEAKIIATALSDPPDGRARWTIRLIANRVVEMQAIDAISRDSVHRVLKKKRLSLG